MPEASYFYCYDGQGNVLAVTDANGNEVAGYQYSAFGELLAESGELEVDNPIRWNGRWGYYYDEDCAEYHVRARPYGPAIARWLAVDPFIFDDRDFNVYRYVSNTPVAATDRSGLFSPAIHTALATQAAYTVNLSNMHILVDGAYVYLYTLLAEYDRNVDTPPTFFELAWHAQNILFVGLVQDQMNEIARTGQAPHGHLEWYIAAMGKALHILQDFYSHTDWIDGKNLKCLYIHYRDSRHADICDNHEPRSATLDLDGIFRFGYTPGVVEPEQLFYFSGGFIPFADDDHNRYAADTSGYGRDATRSKPDPPWLTGAYYRAYNLALRQSVHFLEWAKQNLPADVSALLFSGN